MTEKDDQVYEKILDIASNHYPDSILISEISDIMDTEKEVIKSACVQMNKWSVEEDSIEITNSHKSVISSPGRE